MSLEDEGAEAPAEPASTEPVDTIDAMVEERAAARKRAREAEEAVEETAEETMEEGAEIATDADKMEDGEELPSDIEEPEEANLEEEEEEAAPAVEPPTFYNAEQREHFATLDPVSQAHVAQLARSGLSHVSRLAREAQTQARAEVRTKLEQFDAAVGIAESAFEEKFLSDAELSQLLSSGQTSADAVVAHQMERAAAEAKLVQIKAARDEEDAQWTQRNLQERQAALAERNPQVIKDAPMVVSFLSKRGISGSVLDSADANELEIAWMAAKWEQSQAAAKSITRKPKPVKKVVKPTRGRAAKSQPNAELARLERRASETGSVEDMVALRRMKRRLAKT